MTYGRATALLTSGIAVAFSVYHLWVAVVGVPEPLTFRAIHLIFAMVLIFLIHTGLKGSSGSPPGLLDWLFIAGSVISIGYIFVEYEYFITRFATVDDLRPLDWVMGLTLVGLIFEGTRRILGGALPLTALAFVAYAFIFTRTDAQMMLDQTYMTTEGIFGIPLAVCASYIILFVLFGAFVERTETGKLFMDISMALTGWAPGGPAKVAIVTSGMFGTISGSAVSNVMTTGVFTIPLMKRIGYRPSFSGAVEAVASTGGQIMPPIMGAAAFVMAEFLNVGYLQVAIWAFLPALLYYLAVFFAVHFEAKRTGMRGLPRADLPRAGAVLRDRGHQFLPLIVIVGVLMAGYSAPYAALCGIASVFPVAALRRTTRHVVTLGNIVGALNDGARGTLAVAAACATAGIVIGIISLTGVGIDFTGLVVRLSQDSLIPALVLTALAGIVLGMGLPTTPAYIIQVALLVPALVKLGVAVESAHLFVFYFAILSAITPPVAIAVFAACGLSGGGMWRTGLDAVKLGATGYIVPFMFVFAPTLMLIGAWHDILLTVITSTIGVTLLASSLHGYLLRESFFWERILLFAASLVLIKPGLVTDLIGGGLTVIVVVSQLWLRRPATQATLSAAVKDSD
ncbi:MAG: TRAP transporter permease [Alphaproteobacteria bacterium]|nr:TRAP transporter permease [Alphaproteobacteria bacterium]MCW5742872.1 TRAP transporter permease [Alphaproteobacteria bacterium]